MTTHKQELPTISIVTASYNQNAYIAEALDTVASQDGLAVEHIVIDGGSTDGSVDVIKQHEQDLAHWVSEPDNGQAQAINKGFKRATGDIVGWLNSDDYLLPSALATVARFFTENPDVDIACWPVDVVDENGNFLERLTPRDERDLAVWLAGTLPFPQMGCFWRRKCFETVGYLDEGLHYAFDFEFFARFIKRGIYPAVHNEPVVAAFRMHSQSKTTQEQAKFNDEHEIIITRHLGGASRGVWRRYDHARNRVLQHRRMRQIRDETGIISRSETLCHLGGALVRRPTVTFADGMTWKYTCRILRDVIAQRRAR